MTPNWTAATLAAVRKNPVDIEAADGAKTVQLTCAEARAGASRSARSSRRASATHSKWSARSYKERRSLEGALLHSDRRDASEYPHVA